MMSFITQYQKYFIIIIISCILGLIRWAILDKDFPLMSLSKNQLKTIQIKSQNFFEKIDFELIEQIVSSNSFPIIDARDFESYHNGHIGLAYNIDSELLIQSDEEELEKFKTLITDIINKGNRNIIVYCWNTDCDRAEYLKAFLIDTSEYYGSFGTYFNESDILIYENGWDEWDSIYNFK